MSDTAKGLLSDPAHDRVLSVASLWEMQIKAMLGKLTLRLSLADLVAEHEQKSQLQILPISTEHVYQIGNLPPVHKDPFDRMLAAVARLENATLITDDPIFDQYPVTKSW